MDERAIAPTRQELPLQRQDEGAGPVRRPLDDPRALTILTTEHWSLLSARALVYNEAFARGGMFLTFLSTTLIALGLVWTGTGYSPGYLVMAAVVLAIDLFVGLESMARILAVSVEDARYLQGMNRLRHAYHEIVPGLERYFVSERHDDVASVFAVYGASEITTSRAGILQGFTTTLAMIGVICAALAAVLAGVVLLLLIDAPAVAAAGALATVVVGIVASTVETTRRLGRFAASMESVFPAPARTGSAAGRAG